MTSDSWVNRSTPVRSWSVTTPTGRCSASTTTAGSVGPLVQEGERVGDGLSRGQHDGCVEHEVPLLDPADDLGDDVDRDVLGDDDQSTAAGDGLGHPAARDGRHVRDDEGDGGAAAVRRREIHGLPGQDRGAAGDHEDIVVREVVGDRGRGRVTTGAGLKKTHNTHFFIRNSAGRFHEDTAMDPRVRHFLRKEAAGGRASGDPPYPGTLPEQDSDLDDHYPWTG